MRGESRRWARGSARWGSDEDNSSEVRWGVQTVQLEGTLTARRTNGEALGGAQVTLSVTQPQPMWGRRRLQHKMAAAGVGQAAFAADMPVFWGGSGAIEGGGQPEPPLATQKLTLQPSASGLLSFSLELPVSRVSWGGDQGGGSTPALVLMASVEESATGEIQNGSTTVAATAHGACQRRRHARGSTRHKEAAARRSERPTLGQME